MIVDSSTQSIQKSLNKSYDHDKKVSDLHQEVEVWKQKFRNLESLLSESQDSNQNSQRLVQSKRLASMSLQ